MNSKFEILKCYSEDLQVRNSPTLQLHIRSVTVSLYVKLMRVGDLGFTETHLNTKCNINGMCFSEI